MIYDYKNKLLLSREREIFNNLKYTVISSDEEFEFDKSEDLVLFLNDIKKGKISLEEAKNLKQDYEEYLKEIRKGNKSAEQKFFLANINLLFNARNNAIKFIIYQLYQEVY